jgi:hypothetical protein
MLLVHKPPFIILWFKAMLQRSTCTPCKYISGCKASDAAHAHPANIYQGARPAMRHMHTLQIYIRVQGQRCSTCTPCKYISGCKASDAAHVHRANIYQGSRPCCIVAHAHAAFMISQSASHPVDNTALSDAPCRCRLAEGRLPDWFPLHCGNNGDTGQCTLLQLRDMHVTHM